MKKRISLLLAVLLLTATLCGCQAVEGNLGSSKPQAQQFTQDEIVGSWTLKFTYTAFFKNMATMEDAPSWVKLMTNVSSKAKFELSLTFTDDGKCTYSADPETVMIATEQFAADMQSYLYSEGVYDLFYMEKTWGKAVVDKHLQEQGKTREEYADELIAGFLPSLESAFGAFGEETVMSYTLADNKLNLLVGDEVYAKMHCRYDGESSVVFKQDSPEDVCPFAGMEMKKAD